MILRFDLTSLGPPASKSSQETRSSSELTGSSRLLSVEDYSLTIFNGECCPVFLMPTVSEFPYPQSSTSYILLFESLHLDNAIGHDLHFPLDCFAGASPPCDEPCTIQTSYFSPDGMDD